eukprot:12569631-Ditylum_brightwellii.AAC.1
MAEMSASFKFKFAESRAKIISQNALEPIDPGISGAADSLGNGNWLLAAARACDFGKIFSSKGISL